MRELLPQLLRPTEGDVRSPAVVVRNMWPVAPKSTCKNEKEGIARWHGGTKNLLAAGAPVRALLLSVKALQTLPTAFHAQAVQLPTVGLTGPL